MGGLLRPFSIFSMCHPGDSNKRSLTEYLFEGDRFAKKKWEKFSNNILEEISNKECIDYPNQKDCLVCCN